MNNIMSATSNNTFFVKPAFKLFILLAVYYIVSFILFPIFSNGNATFREDSLAYIDISRKYAALNFHLAINGYWSPLISWLNIPFLHLFKDPFKGLALLKIIIGGVSLIPLYFILKKIKLQFAYGVLWIVTPFFIYWQFHIQTADTLSLLLALCYILVLMLFIEKGTYKYALLLGLTSFFFYTAKYYNFYFIIGHLTVVSIWTLIKRSYSFVGYMKKIIPAILIFGFLIFGWMSCIHWKYGTYTITTAKAYNWAYINPHSYLVVPGSTGAKLAGVPDSMSYMLDDDPSIASYPKWKLSDSPDMLRDYLKNVYANLIHFLNALRYNHCILLSWFILIYLLVFKKLKVDTNLIILISCLIIYPAGYILTVLEPRYVYICNIITIILLYMVIEKIATSNLPLSIKLNKKLLLAITTGLYIITAIDLNRDPVLRLINLYKYPFNKVTTDVYNTNKTWLEVIKGVNICTVNFYQYPAFTGNRSMAIYFCYVNSNKYYGDLNMSLIPNNSDMITQIKTNHIKYILVNDSSKWMPDSVNFKKYAQSTYPPFTAYIYEPLKEQMAP